jgi:hypothetical protein
VPLVTWGLWGLPYVMLDSVSLERYMYTQHSNSGVSSCYSEFSRIDNGYRIFECITLNHTLCNIKSDEKLKESIEQGWIWNCLFKGCIPFIQ